MKRRAARVDAEKKLNKRVVRQTLGGYARADKFIEREKRAWLQGLTSEQSWAIFDELYSAWSRLSSSCGGESRSMEKSRLEEKIALRRALDRAAQKSKRR
ncbi:MAG: hypothetical protein L0Y55_11140 [Anaerolineales bacterium]|nr:hypothetical protein [Anaerolineales bacterium]